MECAGGLGVYFHEWKNTREHGAMMRALLALFGQGGTAGMINRAMLGLYYDKFGSSNSLLEHFDCDLLMQTHDSLTFQAPVEAVTRDGLINHILLKMEIETIFNGMSYSVPCEASIGPRWGKNMVDVTPKMTNNELTIAALKSFDAAKFLENENV
jgi:hypothetical protein